MRALFQRLQERSVLVPLFFVLLFAVSWIGYSAYGVSWDEPNMTNVGEYAYNYVFLGQPWATEAAQRFYGTSFELPLSIVRHVLNITDPRSIFLMRHLLTFWLFIVGVAFFYRLASRHLHSWRMGLLGAFLLVLSPRIFADAFYNSKDIPAMVSFIIAMDTLMFFLEKKTWPRTLAHALATAFVISIRITGILIPAFTVLFLIIHTIRDAQERNDEFSQFVPVGFGYLVLSVIATVAMWPFMWQNPVGHFMEAYHFMSSIGIDTFYMGEQIHHLPWHYVFVWVGITTPLLYTLFFLTGVGRMLWQIVRHPIQFLYHHSNETLFLLWFFTPIAAVYVAGAGIFDGWRHLYFIYPAFLLIALQSIHALWQWLLSLGKTKAAQVLKRVTAGILALNSLYLISWMISNHPIQNVYFSLPKQFIEGKFELDYWGLSFRKGIEYVLAHDDRSSLFLSYNSSPGYSTINVLKPEDRARINNLPAESPDADYFLSDYRFHYTSDYPYEPYKIFTVDGIKILGVYKMR